jgi:hypothetical protein
MRNAIAVLCYRQFNVVLLGTGTRSPIAAAVCRVTGQRFTVSGPATVAAALAELVQLIQATDRRLWCRSSVGSEEGRGWFAEASDQAGRHWLVRPPTIVQGVQPALVA